MDPVCCRTDLFWTGLLQDETLWACVAAMAAYAKELETAEIAYAAIDEVTHFSNTTDTPGQVM